MKPMQIDDGCRQKKTGAYFPLIAINAFGGA